MARSLSLALLAALLALPTSAALAQASTPAADIPPPPLDSIEGDAIEGDTASPPGGEVSALLGVGPGVGGGVLIGFRLDPVATIGLGLSVSHLQLEAQSFGELQQFWFAVPLFVRLDLTQDALRPTLRVEGGVDFLLTEQAGYGGGSATALFARALVGLAYHVDEIFSVFVEAGPSALAQVDATDDLEGTSAMIFGFGGRLGISLAF